MSLKSVSYMEQLPAASVPTELILHPWLEFRISVYKVVKIVRKTLTPLVAAFYPPL